ncbi:hypothetical protein ZOSMA_46G00110 [Zostera marina]|uniref:Uncharacterized protein n=1 Tax=Zostera marina TaxID=29655 RepID=A0A0K9P044_ZOSMR|nr:hypothetical protein ZOSMA_46G00110 [Zostera marina]
MDNCHPEIYPNFEANQRYENIHHENEHENEMEMLTRAIQKREVLSTIFAKMRYFVDESMMALLSENMDFINSFKWVQDKVNQMKSVHQDPLIASSNANYHTETYPNFESNQRYENIDYQNEHENQMEMLTRAKQKLEVLSTIFARMGYFVDESMMALLPENMDFFNSFK